MKLFPATAPLDSVAIGILGELIRKPRGHSHMLVITARFMKPVKGIPKKVISTCNVSKLFIDNLMLNMGFPTELFSENGSQFTYKFFIEVCHIFNTKNAFINI